MFNVLRENVHMEGRVVVLFQVHDVAPVNDGPEFLPTR